LGDNVFLDTMEGLEGELVDKCINVAAYFQNLEADAKAMKEAEARIKSRRVSMENKANRLRQYLKDNLERSGILKIECPEFSVTIRKPSDIVDIFHEDLVPMEFVQVTTLSKIDKNALKKALKEGTVAGAKLVKGKSSLLVR